MSRWYFGGLASCGAACCTHPLDLIKVSARGSGERRLGSDPVHSWTVTESNKPGEENVYLTK